MNKQIIYKKNSRTGKYHPTKYKDNKTWSQERSLVYSWCVENLIATEPYEYVSSETLYKKFKEDLQLELTHKSFGMYLLFGLPKLGFNTTKVIKMRGMKAGKTFFGLGLKGLPPETQHFPINQVIGYGKYLPLNNPFFSIEKVETWLSQRLTIHENFFDYKTLSRELFEDYCNYYNISLINSVLNLQNFGKILGPVLQKNYPFVKKVTTSKGYKAYTCLKFKE